MKKTVCILLSVLMLLAALPLAGHAAEIVDSGACGAEGDGSNLTWTLDDAGTLTISGTGKMEEYNTWDNPAPWGTSVKKAVMQSGVTRIGGEAFFVRGSGCAFVIFPDKKADEKAKIFCFGILKNILPFKQSRRPFDTWHIDTQFFMC